MAHSNFAKLVQTLETQVSAQLPRWVDRQWELHQQTLQSSGRATWDPKTIADAIRPLRTLVLGPAEYFPNSLFVTCPVYYHQLLRKTFGDPAVLQPCRNGTARIIQHLRQDFESRHPELQMLAYKGEFIPGHGIVFYHANTVSFRFHIER